MHSASGTATAGGNQAMDFIALAQECAPLVAHETMAAIVRTESAFRPLAIGINGAAQLIRQPTNKEEAVVTANWLIAHGYSIDMGLAQINSANLKRTGLSVADAFDPCKNLSAAATILHENYQSASLKEQDAQLALHAALSAYNTGSFTRGFSNGYVQKVLNNAKPAPAFPTAPPIPLVNKQASGTGPMQTERPVKLEAETIPTNSSGTSVYGTDRSNASVMVY